MALIFWYPKRPSHNKGWKSSTSQSFHVLDFHPLLWLGLLSFFKSEGILFLPSYERTMMCWTLSPYCGFVFWDIKKIMPYFFMPWVYILFDGGKSKKKFFCQFWSKLVKISQNLGFFWPKWKKNFFIIFLHETKCTLVA